ncbi:hypothetical protein [Rosenbergiella collisarenosi]|uniref:hypothetical protein n=1 Tax=Rosenbergiella collisarenosi TaxID=1544695 RepID=UPI0034DFF896
MTTLTVNQSRWVLTGHTIGLDEVEGFVQQLLASNQVKAFRLNDLKQHDDYYEFRISFSLSPLGGDQ